MSTKLMPIERKHFNLLHKDIPAVLQSGVWLPEVKSLFSRTLVLQLKALLVREPWLIDFLSSPSCCRKLLWILKEFLLWLFCDCDVWEKR